MLMSTGDTAFLQEMKKVIEEGKPLDIDVRDRLLFSAVIDIYEKQEDFKKQLAPVVTFYKVGMYFTSALGTLLIGLLFAVLTGQVEFVFK